MTTTPHQLDAASMRAAYGHGTLSPVEVTRSCLDRIASIDGAINAFCFVDEESALESAVAAERRWREGTPLGILDGIPVAVKDLLLTRGWPTLRGSLTIDPDQPWVDDAPSVDRLRRNGAVLLGKTTTSELGWKAVGDSPLTGTTRNPLDLSRTPGGSSAGSAAAVASGMVPLALGTDAGGSVRIPAAFTGTVGLKPTHGRVPAWPPSPFSSISHIGPMARTAADAALLLAAIAGEDPRDWWTRGAHRLDADPAFDIVGLRVALSFDLAKTIDPAVHRAVESAAAVLESLGAHIEPVELGLPDVTDAFGVLWSVAVAAGLEGLDPGRRALLDPGLADAAERGSGVRAADHAAAEVARHRYANAVASCFVDHDLLVTPTVPIVAFAVDHDSPGRRHDSDWSWWAPFSYPFNLTGHPAISVPCGVDDDGLPIGLQIVGRHQRDELVLAAGAAYEAAWHPASTA